MLWLWFTMAKSLMPETTSSSPWWPTLSQGPVPPAGWAPVSSQLVWMPAVLRLWSTKHPAERAKICLRDVQRDSSRMRKHPLKCQHHPQCSPHKSPPFHHHLHFYLELILRYVDRYTDIHKDLCSSLIQSQLNTNYR